VIIGHHHGEVVASDSGWSEKREKATSTPSASFMHSHPLLHFVSVAPIPV
jgi:hypothetical protein